jgi:large subunit ribosomal protein LP1
MSNDELASTYASLALHDAGLAVTADKINAMAKKAGVDVAAFWPNFFERVLKTQSLDDIILNAGSGILIEVSAIRYDSNF